MYPPVGVSGPTTVDLHRSARSETRLITTDNAAGDEAVREITAHTRYTVHVSNNEKRFITFAEVCTDAGSRVQRRDKRHTL